MREKPLASGKVAYFWAPPTRDVRAGFTIKSEALGTDYGAACDRAGPLNRHLDGWRDGLGAEKSLDVQPGVGTLEWAVEVYKRGPAWEKVSKRSRPEYDRAFKLVLRHKTKVGTEVGAAPLKTITTLAVDKLYAALQKGKKVERRLTQANKCMIRMARVWDYVQSRYPTMFAVPNVNPFRAVEMEHSKGTTRARPPGKRRMRCTPRWWRPASRTSPLRRWWRSSGTSGRRTCSRGTSPGAITGPRKGRTQSEFCTTRQGR